MLLLTGQILSSFVTGFRILARPYENDPGRSFFKMQ